MINLLPNGKKDDILAARANIILARYIGIVLLGYAFVFMIFATSQSVLDRTMETAQSRIETNTVKADVYTSTQQEVTALSSKLSEAKSLLNNDVRYSEILPKIGALIPSGVVLKELTLNDSAISGTPLKITAYARSTAEASTLQTQLQSSGLFSQVSIQKTDTSGGISGYPVVVSLSASIKKGGVSQ